jgi:integrase
MAAKDNEQMLYLQKQKSGVYYFVRPVPKELKPIYGKQLLISKSLKTKDTKEAKRLVIEMTYATDQDFNNHLERLNEIKPRKNTNEVVLNEDVIKGIASQYKRHLLINDDTFRREWARISNTIEALPDFNYTNKTFQYIELLKKYELFLARYNTSEFNDEYDTFINHLKLNIKSPSSRMIETLKLAMMSSYVEVLQELVNRGGGKMKPTDDIAPKVALSFEHSNGKNLIHLFELWKTEQGSSLNPKTERSFKSICSDFNLFIKGKAAKDTKRDDVVRWVNELDQVSQLKEKTVLNKIRVLHAVYEVGISNSVMENNPSHKVKAKGGKSEDRRPFTNDEIPLIFDEILSTKNHGKIETYKWLAVLSYTVGTRIEEVSQLTFEDIYEEKYTVNDEEHSRWSIIITDKGDGQHIKNIASRRRVPIHLDVLNAGFIDFYNRRKKQAKSVFLFNDLPPNKDNIRSGSFSKWANRKIDKINPDTTIVMHSFRHLYRDLVSTVVPTIDEEVKDRLLGHADGSVGRKYGATLYPIHSLIDAVDRLILPFKIPKITS